MTLSEPILKIAQQESVFKRFYQSLLEIVTQQYVHITRIYHALPSSLSSSKLLQLYHILHSCQDIFKSTAIKCDFKSFEEKIFFIAACQQVNL